jgi:hypothetical protein
MIAGVMMAELFLNKFCVKAWTDIHVSVHHDQIYENDQEDATV